MRAILLLPLLALAACATIPEPAGGDQGLPSANAGPFRALVTGELGNSRSVPNAFDDSRDYGRDIAVLDLDGKPETLEVAAYVAAAIKENGMDPTPDSPTRSIVRYGALDGRSFDRSATLVLSPDAAWEGDVLNAPAAVLVKGEVFLYYAAAGGIGLSRSSDGMTFTKEASPVLGPADSGWDQGATPASPGAVVLADGSFRMFYEVSLPSGETAIGEAESNDGVSFTRTGSAPVLSSAKDAAEYDEGGVGSPFPILATSGDGRAITRVYYGARDAAGTRTIGLAARYGDSGPLSRAVSPVFGTSKPLGPREPCVVAFDGFTLLYATEDASTTNHHPAVAAGVTPATVTLPPPDPK